MPSPSEAIAIAAGVLGDLDRQARANDLISDPRDLRGVRGFEPFGLEDPRTVAYGYWRLPSGRIAFEQYRHNTFDRFMRKWQMLPQYGEYKLSGQAGWNPHTDPYAALVVRGGAEEMPLDQLRELRWHRRPGPTDRGAVARVWARIDEQIQRGLAEPDAVEVVLPQLVGTDWREWRDYKCQFCPQRVFNTMEDVARHESVMHREDVRSREIRDSIGGALEKSGNQNAPILETLTEVLAKLAADGAEQRAVVMELLGRLAAPAPVAAPEPPAKPKATT